MFMKKPLLFPFKKESFVDSDRRFTYLFQSHLKHLVICMLLLLGSILQGYSQNFTNGSFTGTKGDNVAAPGWTIIPPTFGTSNTPDIHQFLQRGGIIGQEVLQLLHQMVGHGKIFLALKKLLKL
jgi:hypothetical protein